MTHTAPILFSNTNDSQTRLDTCPRLLSFFCPNQPCCPPKLSAPFVQTTRALNLTLHPIKTLNIYNFRIWNPYKEIDLYMIFNINYYLELHSAKYFYDKCKILSSKDVNVLWCSNNQFNLCWQETRYIVNNYSIVIFHIVSDIELQYFVYLFLLEVYLIVWWRFHWQNNTYNVPN